MARPMLCLDRTMPSPLHEQLIDLLRTRPALAAELLGRVSHVRIAPAAAAAVRTGSQTFSELRPPEYRADLVVELGAPCTELAIVVEVQLGMDDEKRGSWPQYVAALWRRLRCPVWLLVVAVDEAVASWCARSIEMGGMQLRPVVAGPRDIPSMTDPRAARAAPELAVLSALAHARDPEGPAICKVATEVVLSQRLPERYTYIDLMLSRLPELARRALEEWMSTSHEYQSELFRRLVDQGRAEGKAEGEAKGRAEGKAEAILAVLAARGLATPERVAVRVRGCREPAELDRLLRRAALIGSADELLE
ncbi:MAG: hypothetical protein HY905_14385 [Deltaproteobacteria bacterium]|nr:hypothetical protein [Deltaproteobacteria bacterium]